MISILIIRRILISVLTGLAVVAVAACSDPVAEEGDVLTIVATTTILGDIVKETVGDRAEVIVILPVAADPHDFEPSSRDIAQLSSADLVVANGLALETGLLPALAAAQADGVNVVEIAPQVDPLSLGDSVDDPHFWMDPLRVVAAVDVLASELEQVDGSIGWSEMGSRYIEILEAGHDEIVEILSPIENRKLITNHDALRYFAARYSFEIVDTVIPQGTDLADPSSAELAALVQTIQHLDLPAIFAETIQPAELARSVAAEAGRDVKVVELYTDSLGEPGSDAGTLIGMLIADARLIAEALAS